MKHDSLPVMEFFNFLKTYWLTAKLLLALASIMILGFESKGTHDLILLTDCSGSL
jgi:hypothetical protein